MLSSFLAAAEAVAGIKKQEVPLPIAQKQAIVTPLRVGDDLSLRSSLTSPVNYDREMTRMMYDHTEVVLAEGEVPVKENFERFCATLSNIDKICLISLATRDLSGRLDFSIPVAINRISFAI